MPGDMSFAELNNPDNRPNIQTPKPLGMDKPNPEFTTAKPDIKFELGPAAGGSLNKGEEGTGADAQEQQRKFFEAMFGIGSVDRGGYTEIANKTSSAEVKHSNRMLLAITEQLEWNYDQKPNPYQFDYGIIQALHTRAEEMEITFPLGLGSYSKADKEAGLDKDENEAQRLALASSYREAALEDQARLALLKKVDEQEIFGDDIEQSTVNAFTRLGKEAMDSRYYGVIFRMSETYPGMEKYGEKVENALNLWKNVAEGKAAVEVKIQKPDGTVEIQTKILPNPFALQRNTGLMQVTMDAYVIPHLKSNAPLPAETNQTKKNALQKLELLDNQAAAITALNLVNHWDLDMTWGMGVWGYKEQWTEDDIKNWTLELAFKDAGKMAHFDARRRSEWAGGPGKKEGHRFHPRVAGPPSTLGCFPDLTANALDIITTEVVAVRDSNAPDSEVINAIAEKLGIKNEKEKNQKIIPGVSLSNLGLSQNKMSELLSELRKDKKYVISPDIDLNNIQTVSDLFRMLRTRKISVSIANAVWSGGKIERLENNQPVKWTFDPLKFRDIPWDDISILDVDGKILQQSQITFASTQNQVSPTSENRLSYLIGVPTNAFEVPYKLQGFLAYKNLFAQVMRVDYDNQYKEIMTTDTLWKMNKGIDNALGLLATGYNLDKDTVDALNKYIRVTFLGGIAASIITHSTFGSSVTEHLEQWPQVPISRASDKTSVVDGLEMISVTTRFLSVSETEKGPKLDPVEKQLLEYIANTRKAPTPFELVNIKGLENWFSPAQREKLKPLYPQIV